MRSAIELGN